MTNPFLGVIFDMDGTLTRPTLDFALIRRELGFEPGDVAHQIHALPPDQQPAAWAIIQRHEDEAMRRQDLQDGAAALLADLRRDGCKLGIATRNARRSVDHLCQRFHLEFDAIVAREFPYMKPHPEVVLHILRHWNLPAPQVLTVGDYVHDLDCGRAAGTATCFFHNPGHTFHGANANFVVSSMQQLRAILYRTPGAPPGRHE